MKTKLFLAAAAMLAGLAPAAPVAAHEAAVVVAETDEALPGFTIYRPTGIDDGPAPVVIWGNGACAMNHTPWMPIIERLAADGYVVIATGDAAGSWVSGQPGDERPRYTDEDLERAVDWAIAAGADEQSRYAGQLDADRIALAGNSCGGITSTALASRDDRIASIFILSGGSIGPMASLEDKAAIMGTITAPLMYVVGGEEDFARAPASQDFSLIPEGVPMLVVGRFAGDHGFVSITPSVVQTVSEMAESWFDGTLRGDQHAIERLHEEICSTCASDVWSVVETKHLLADD